MTREEIESFIESHGLEGPITLADGLDNAFIGVHTEGDTPCAVYSIDKCIFILAEQMTKEEASEYFWFNVAGAGGEGFPIYVFTPEEGKGPYD